MKKGIELLSPAGSAQALTAAVQSGADAVYIGGPDFNARHSAENFTIEDIKKYADYCHLYGVDLHIAVNTLIKERETKRLVEYVKELCRAGADALIVQDIGAASLIKEACPDIALHASTQMTVTSVEGVRYLESMGFSRVVLARELTKREIENIVKNTDAEIEVFVHGALCMCYSGQCLMSSIIGGRSANRGRCAQPCRLPYSVTADGKNTAPSYALSPKDLSLINEIDELKRIGVTSLKIEGRLKRAEYVSAVTGIYRKYIDMGIKASDSDMTELKNAFSRSGFTQGYFNGKLGAEMMSHKTPGNISENVFTPEAKSRAAIDANIRKIPVMIYASLKENEPLTVTITDGDYNTVTVSGTIKAEKAINSPIDTERIVLQLKKLGSTPFTATEVYAEADEGITVPVKEINEVRRMACAALMDKRTERVKKRVRDISLKRDRRNKTKDMPYLTAECETAEQAKACASAGIDILYVPVHEAKKLRDVNAKIVVRTEDIFKGEEVPFKNIAVSSPAAALFYGGNASLYGGHRLNVYNSFTADVFKDMELVTISPELNLGEAKAVIENTQAKTELTAYGRLTLMLMKNCPLKALNFCQGHKNGGALRDRKNEEFPILCTPSCTARLLNSKPIFMADKLSDLINTGADALRLVFTTESADKTREIAELYKKALDGEAVGNIFEERGFTRGHYYRGVE